MKIFSQSMKKESIILIGIIIGYVLLRLLLVSSNRDTIFDQNEFLSGTIAMELIQGPSLPLKYCMQDNRSYGSIVNGILSAPFYLFFGPSSASSKMVSILFSLGVLVFWYLLLNRFFNQRVAIITSLLFILSPTVYTKCSVLSVGSHPETNLFTSIIIFILYLIFFDNKKGNKYFILLGLISGFSFFYSYLSGITLLVLLIFWFVFDRKFILRPKFYLFLIFFLIGFSPRVYFTGGGVKPAFEGVSFFLRDAFRNGVSFVHIMPKTKEFLLKDLPRLFAFKYMPNSFQYIYYIFFIISFFSLLWFDRHLIHELISLKLKKVIISNKSLFLIFPLIFSLVYILSRYNLQQEGWQFAGYIVPLYPFIFVTMGIFFDKVFRKNKFLKTLSVIVLSLFLMVGLYENLALISFSKIGQGFIYAGYSYRFFGERIGTYRNFNNNRILEAIRTIAFQKRKYFLEGLGWSMAPTKGEEDILKEILDDDSMKRFYFSDQEKFHYYKGLGRGVAYSILMHIKDQKGILRDYTIFEPNLTILKSVIEKKDVKTNRYFWEGFGQEVNLSHDVYQMIIKNYLEDQFKPYLYRGIGETIAWRFLDKNDKTGFRYSEIPAKYREDIYSSYRETRSRMLLKDYR